MAGLNRTVTMVNLDKTGYRQDCVVEKRGQSKQDSMVN